MPGAFAHEHAKAGIAQEFEQDADVVDHIVDDEDAAGGGFDGGQRATYRSRFALESMRKLARTPIGVLRRKPKFGILAA